MEMFAEIAVDIFLVIFLAAIQVRAKAFDLTTIARIIGVIGDIF